VGKVARILAAAALLAAASSADAADRKAGYGQNPADLAAWLARLAEAYPDTVAGFDDTALVLKDGSRLPLSDGDSGKSFDTLLDRPDIGDMFAFAYPADAVPSAPALNADPGRIRVEALFRALYGDCGDKDFSARLTTIDWVPGHGGGTIRVTTAQGVDKALAAVSEELDRLPKSFAQYLVPTGGTYNCRSIAGTSRRSMHAYAAAIDLNTRYSAYWQWTKPDASGLYQWSNRIPREIVDIFERHGFIWGGRWYHFDTMHFEYRPDLLPGGRGTAEKKKPG